MSLNVITTKLIKGQVATDEFYIIL